MLVSSTRQSAIDECLRLAEQLAIEGMSLDAFVMNRVQRPAGAPGVAEIAAALGARLPAWPAERLPELADKVARVAGAQNEAAGRAAEQVRHVERRLDALTRGSPPPLELLPELPANVQGVDALAQIAEVLARVGSVRA